MSEGGTTYRYNAVRNDGWWVLHSVDVRGAHSQVRRLDQAEGEARKAISMVLEVPDDSFDIDLDYELPEESKKIVSAAVKIRKALTLVERVAGDITRAAAISLTTDGLPLRDVGFILGVTHQRAHQLAQAEDRHNESDTADPVAVRRVAESVLEGLRVQLGETRRRERAGRV